MNLKLVFFQIEVQLVVFLVTGIGPKLGMFAKEAVHGQSVSKGCSGVLEFQELPQDQRQYQNASDLQKEMLGRYRPDNGGGYR